MFKKKEDIKKAEPKAKAKSGSLASPKLLGSSKSDLSKLAEQLDSAGICCNTQGLVKGDKTSFQLYVNADEEANAIGAINKSGKFAIDANSREITEIKE